MEDNPLQGLEDFYNEGVKKADEKGFAEIYKKATDLLFKRIEKEINRELHFEDVKFSDGYFIFGLGTNSVVEFHIKEAPGWLGGIWWKPIPTDETKDFAEEQRKYKTDCIQCELFFQFEKEIDKFNPSASSFGGDAFDFHFADGYVHSGYLNACWDLRFIIDEPYLAFYKEMYYTNFNHKYVSRAEAKRYWDKHWREREKELEIKHTNAQAMYDTFKYIMGPAVEDGDAFITDSGSCISPRYAVVIKNFKFEDGSYWVEKDGCYNLFDGYKDAEKDKKLYDKVRNQCAKRAKSNYYFDNPFSTAAYIVREPSFTKSLQEAIANNQVLYYKKEDGTVYEGQIKCNFEG